MKPTTDINIRSTVRLIAPCVLKAETPISESATQTVLSGRDTVCNILSGEDRRLMAVVGPCSIHDEDAAMEYARRLKGLAERVADRIYVVMRVYFEKPRTTIGWKGLINDPFMDGSFNVEEGMRKGRRILMQINELGLPAASEMLDPITPQYTAGLITWASIGARTTESQTHRQMASGLSMPVGFKNGTDGLLQTALDALESARHPHSFLGIDDEGNTCVIHTKGNPWGHLILRGGQSGPNYFPQNIADATARLTKANQSTALLVDCSHANSGKDYRKQPSVLRHVVEQRAQGTDNIVGVMIESNLHEGSQSIPDDLAALRYGVSVTDGCIGWEQTEAALLEAFDELAAVTAPRSANPAAPA